MAKEAYYFSHDSNARQDPKVLAMMSVYGPKGYGWYWILVEMMREQDGYTLSLQGKYSFNAIAMQMHTTSNEAEQFVHDCIDEFELFESDGQVFWSNSLLRRMEMKEQISQKRKKAAEKRWNKQKKSDEGAEGMQMHNSSNANAMQGKESKGKESKENKEIHDLFDHYLSKSIIQHSKITEPMKRAIRGRLKDYTLEDLKKAIDNYAVIYAGDEYWFTHKYPLADLMRDKDIRKFLDEADPLNNFRKGGQTQAKPKKQIDWDDI